MSADRWEFTGWVMISGSWECFADVSGNISIATTVPCQGTGTLWCRTGSIISACALRSHVQKQVFWICGQGPLMLCIGEIGWSRSVTSLSPSLSYHKSCLFPTDYRPSGVSRADRWPMLTPSFYSPLKQQNDYQPYNSIADLTQRFYPTIADLLLWPDNCRLTKRVLFLPCWCFDGVMMILLIGLCYFNQMMRNWPNDVNAGVFLP